MKKQIGNRLEQKFFNKLTTVILLLPILNQFIPKVVGNMKETSFDASSFSFERDMVSLNVIFKSIFK